jgi:hypothetical protein
MGILGCGDVTEIKVVLHSKTEASKLKLLWERDYDKAADYAKDME